MIAQLGKREILIIKHLIHAKKPISSDLLGVILGVSPKTIRSSMIFVGEILKIAGGAKLISKTGSGYFLEIFDEKEFRVFTQTFNAKYLDAYWIPTHASGRVTYIIRRLLFTNQPLKMEKLMDELYVSRVTLTKDLREVRRLLKMYHLRLEHRAKYGLRVQGKEMHLRVMLVDYLDVDEDSNSFDGIDDTFLYKRDPKIISDAVTQILVTHKLSVSTNSLRKVVKLIIVSEFRHDQQHLIYLSDEERLNMQSKREFEAANELVKALAINNWSLDEVCFIAIFIISRRNIMKNEPFSVAQEAMYLEDSRQLLEKLHESLNIDFSIYPDLKIELAKHLRGMHYRLKYGLEKRDVGILESKGSNPAFEYAVLASYWLSEKLDKPIQETEIVFLSYRFYMHFQLMSFHKKSNVLVVLSNGKNTADLFIHELLANFGKYIDCAEGAEFYEIPFIDVKPYDCILTDIPAVQFDVNIDVKRVNYFFTEQDHIKLKNYFTHTQINSKNFIACFDERLFFKDIEYDDKHEIIQFMLNEIQKYHALDLDGYKQIELREKLSSTERGNGVAIPHTLTVMADQPIIAVGVTKRPFQWDKEVCQLVILVINGHNEAAPFLALSIAKAATGNIELVYDLIKSDTFDKAIYAIEQFVDHFEFY